MVEFLIDQALKEAIDLHNRNQLDDAKSLYNKIIEHDKSNSDAYHLLSLINLVEGEYEEAKNGAEALNLVNNGFSLIVLDLDMPVMNGFEFMRSIDGLDNLKDIPIIVFSGMELDAEQSETVNQYTAGIINKTDLDHEDRLTELLGNLMAVKPAS